MPIANINYVNNIRAIKRKKKIIESIFYFLNNKYFL